MRRRYSILVTTGVRLDEAALLKWEDVKKDAKEGFLHFDTTKGIVQNDGSKRQVGVQTILVNGTPFVLDAELILRVARGEARQCDVN